MTANVTDWIAYAVLRGDAVAAGDLADQALQRASDYIRTRYVLRLGLAETDAAVIEATYIAAQSEITTPGFWSTVFTPSQAKVLTKVDKIEWSPIGGGSKGADSMLPTSPAIEALLMTGTGWGMPAVFSV